MSRRSSPWPHRLAGLALALACTSALAGQVVVRVLDKDGKPVPDAVVSVTPATRGGTPPVLPAQGTIQQEKMQFVPMVSVVPVGARIRFTNQDAWDHHVRGSAAGMAQFSGQSGGGFELRLDGKAEGKPAHAADVVFDKPGAVLLGCHLHGSMRGYVVVTDTPWTLKTDATGQAVLDGLPDGAATLRVWQADQLIDLPARPIAVGPAPLKVDVQLSVVPRRRRI